MNTKVSIVIICMNNLKYLYPCLDSIKTYTKISYETLVVAYLFSDENLQKLKQDYSWVEIIESNEIRGFSENNNLALRKAKGEYCFVLNDDTYFNMDVLEGLLQTFKKLAINTAVVSPNILNPDGTIQYCGRPYYDWKDYIFPVIFQWFRGHEYVNNTGVFQSFNISGAAFLIKTKIFREVGFFDEYYFFSPEDLALSTKLNKLGYTCYVNADIELTHIGGMTGKSLSMIQTATKPANVKGSLYFYSNGKYLLKSLLIITTMMLSLLRYIYHYLKSIGGKDVSSNNILAICDLNILKSLFSRKKPKEVFIHYYNQLK